MLPEVVRTVTELRDRIHGWRRDGARIALVPTMGSLHDGHLSLVRLARSRADKVVVSIFVNPKQFAAHEDLDSYPRSEQEDLAKLAALKTDLVFAPGVREMYPPDFSTRVRVETLSEGLCGDARPHFFEGVAMVVAKLLIQALPDIAVFGEKDYQQLLIIRRMVRDLNIPVEIVGGPLIREADGLAMSSRNAYMSREERAIAGKLNRIMTEIVRDLAAGADIAARLEAGRSALAAAGFTSIDYLEVRSSDRLEPLTNLDRPARLFAGVWVGKTRLIDNMPI